MLTAAFDQLAHQRSGDAAPSIFREDIYVPNASETFLRLVRLVAYPANAGQLIINEGSEEDFSGAIEPFRTVDPVFAQPPHESCAVCLSVFSQSGESRFRIEDRADFEAHLSASALSNTLSNIAWSNLPVFWL